jgi:peptide-methionine (S)-S-oxide reductase
MAPSETATLAAGCFWKIEHHFLSLDGILSTAVGYTGGDLKNPSYQEVCRGHTRHAEAVQINFNPLVISFPSILNHFWQLHDPTQRDRQGPDIGSQYRSAIFIHSQEQLLSAQNSLKTHQQKIKKPIVTEIVKASTFWLAEEYHQKYIQKKRLS